MESVSSRIEAAYRKKVSLMQGLLGCLNLEKESLVSLDVKSLWSLMEEKDSLLASIGRTDQEIRAAEAEGADGAGLPKDVTPAVKGLSREIRRLKMEIRARVKENVSFIQETLRFFDEIISIFAAGNRAEPSYDPLPKRARSSTSLIYQREV
ncbi:MAG: flagellar export chaperone FlgN [Thermodesulfobacteriota bacterium]